MARTEKTFQAEIKRSLSILDREYFYWKIADLGFINPFDSILITNKKSFAFEYKIVKNSNTINFKNLFKNRIHQIQYLKKVKNSGGHGIVLINVFKPREFNYSICLDIDSVIDLMGEKDSFKTDYIFELFPESKINKIKRETALEDFWDVNKILNISQITI